MSHLSRLRGLLEDILQGDDDTSKGAFLKNLANQKIGGSSAAGWTPIQLRTDSR